MKAGDGGNGRCGTDGKGGIDSTDGTAPTNGTKGAAGGAAGSVGIAYYSLRTYAGYTAGWYNGTGGTKTYTNNQNTYGNISIYYNITGSYGYESLRYTCDNVTFNVYAGPEGEFLSTVCYGY